jgi:hypothetical protein
VIAINETKKVKRIEGLFALASLRAELHKNPGRGSVNLRDFRNLPASFLVGVPINAKGVNPEPPSLFSPHEFQTEDRGGVATDCRQF